ncbi:MAG TPA: porin [Xanthobacteraceae bacterium]|nr:porin [Xanthobacteraceae bacterium]
MKNFKSLILGSAAAMFAVAGAQAADLPVKAKPVEYVKVCSAYGAGFYYIPGTDICLRVGGFLFSDFSVNNRGDTGNLGTGATRDRTDDWTAFRIRSSMIFDARTNTEYGTLRSYLSAGFQWDTAANGQTWSQANTGNSSWYWNAAFIQFAGFTFGLAGSFFDFVPHMTMFTFSSKSVSTSPMIAYTAQLGQGISASISMEDGTARRSRILAGGYDPTTAGTDLYAAQFMPDFIANIRVSQAWGDAQIAGAIHQVKINDVTPAPNSVEYGYAFLGGLNFKLPMIGANDSFQIEGVWSKGAVAFTGINASSYTKASTLSYVTSNGGPFFNPMDAYATGGAAGMELTKAYSVNAQFRHFWTPTLRSTIGYGYLKVDTPSAGNTAGFPDARLHQVVGNLIWSPVKNLDIGTELYWNDLKTSGTTALAGAPANDSQSWWGGAFRVTRYW